MEEKQARETLPARTRVWQWRLGEGREPHLSFTLTNLTCLSFPKKAHLPVGQAWQISSCLRGQVRGPRGDVWVSLCPDGLCQTGGEGLWVL